MAAPGLDFGMVPVSWKDCTGYAQNFASERIENFVTFPAAGYSTSTWADFTSPRLKESLFYEIQHYVDRSLYHLIVGKWMVCSGALTWGLVSYYYSSFFAAQAAIRLKGIFFVKINWDSETVVPPTHRLEVVNLLNDRYRIRKAAGVSEHKRVWNVFFEQYGKLSARPGFAKYSPIVAETDPDLRLVEMHRRHLVNYVPGYGYQEIRSQKAAQLLKAELSRDLFQDRSKALDHDDGQLEVRAFMRLELCLHLLNEISLQGGHYQIHHPALTIRRRKMLRDFSCPGTLEKRVETVLIG